MMDYFIGDIGGTKTALATVRELDGRLTLLAPRRYVSADYPDLDSLLAADLALGDRPREFAALAIAGPVFADRSETTNLPWRIDARALEQNLGLTRVRLLNDLEAIAWSLPALIAEQLTTLLPGDLEARGNACVVAAGTGLGQAGLFWDGTMHWPFATEGGHTDFAPSDAREWALLQYVQQRFGRVSWERLVSGMGIAEIHAFLTQGEAPQPEIRGILDSGRGDLAATVARLAQRGDCPRAAETMTLFAQLYGRECGNCALKFMALGGVYLAGGIAPQNLALLRGEAFRHGFLDKGRLRPLLERIPVHVVLEPHAALLGGARFLAHLGETARHARHAG